MGTNYYNLLRCGPHSEAKHKWTGKLDIRFRNRGGMHEDKIIQCRGKFEPFHDRGNGCAKNGRRNREEHLPEPAISEERREYVQSAMREHGYEIGYTALSFGVRQQLAGGAELEIRPSEKRTRLGFRYKNPDGSAGGFVEINCHLHGINTIDCFSRVLDSASIGNCTIRHATIIAGKAEECAIEKCRIYRSVLADSTITESTLKNALIGNSTLRGETIDMEKAIGRRCGEPNPHAGKSA